MFAVVASKRPLSLGSLLGWVRLLSRKQDMLAEPAIDVVKVMTHHAAKGLEWPVVVLTDLAKGHQEPALVSLCAIRGKFRCS